MAIPDTVIELGGGYRVIGPIPATVVRLAGGFELSRPAATIFAWDGEWVPSAQRVWTATGWFPAVVQ